jgi:hypothetical protein
VQGLAVGDAAGQAHGGAAQVGLGRREQVGPDLEVAGVLGRLAVDNAGLVRRDEGRGLALLGDLADELLERRGELLEADRVLDELPAWARESGS